MEDISCVRDNFQDEKEKKRVSKKRNGRNFITYFIKKRVLWRKKKPYHGKSPVSILAICPL